MTSNGMLVTQCALRDISVTGANIAVEDPTTVPNEFVLLFTKNGSVRRDCSLVWRGDSHVGVRFSSRPSQ
jgi:PilZ domain